MLEESLDLHDADEVELELIRVRSAAEAAELRSRAAALELVLRRLRAGDADGGSCPFGPSSVSRLAVDVFPSPRAHIDSIDFGMSKEASPTQMAAVSAADATDPVVGEEPLGSDLADTPSSVTMDRTGPWAFVDGPDDSELRTLAPTEAAQKAETTSAAPSEVERINPQAVAATIGHVAQGEQADERRMRPAAWMVSTLAHIAVLIALALMTLQATPPKDAISLSASTAEVAHESMETFEIESSELLHEESEPAPADVSLDVSPIGTFAATDFAVDQPLPSTTLLASDLLSSSAASRAAMTLKASGDTKTEFCGVEGGGKHFVYLVDSSGSMTRFEHARDELLRSVAALTAEQRFYVVFFDANPDYMRIEDPSHDEPTSVNATPENKAALKRWAMTITKDRGMSPYKPLEFAFKLRPDVIFLLSDGQFTAKTEEVIRENNFQENLFGERRPISIIHTIRYPGTDASGQYDAEKQMMRIAKENGGQYRNVVLP